MFSMIKRNAYFFLLLAMVLTLAGVAIKQKVEAHYQTQVIEAKAETRAVVAANTSIKKSKDVLLINAVHQDAAVVNINAAERASDQATQVSHAKLRANAKAVIAHTPARTEVSAVDEANYQVLLEAYQAAIAPRTTETERTNYESLTETRSPVAVDSDRTDLVGLHEQPAAYGVYIDPGLLADSELDATAVLHDPAAAEGSLPQRVSGGAEGHPDGA